MNLLIHLVVTIIKSVNINNISIKNNFFQTKTISEQSSLV